MDEVGCGPVYLVDVVEFADDVELGVDGVQQSGHRHRADEAADGGA